MFDFVNPGAKRLGRITIFHRHGGLNHRRTCVDLFLCEVDGHTGQADSPLQRLSDRVNSRK